MFNDIHVGPVTFHMYGLMIALGFLCAFWLCCVQGKKKGMPEEEIRGFFYCAVLGGLLGAKLLYVLISIPELFKNPFSVLNPANGLVVYGGIIGGIFACWVYCRKKEIIFLECFDLVMPAVSLGQGIGRIGCLFAGCCYGKQTNLPIGIIYQNSSYAPNGVKLMPTQLISSIGDFLICLLLLKYASKECRRGRIGAMWMILYGIGRFLVEFLRNDYRGSMGFLSTSQAISLAVGTTGAFLFLRQGRMEE